MCYHSPFFFQFIQGYFHPLATELVDSKILHDLISSCSAGNRKTIDHVLRDVIAAVRRYSHAHPPPVGALHPVPDVIDGCSGSRSSRTMPTRLEYCSTAFCDYRNEIIAIPVLVGDEVTNAMSLK